MCDSCQQKKASSSFIVRVYLWSPRSGRDTICLVCHLNLFVWFLSFFFFVGLFELLSEQGKVSAPNNVRVFLWSPGSGRDTDKWKERQTICTACQICLGNTQCMGFVNNQKENIIIGSLDFFLQSKSFPYWRCLEVLQHTN